MKILSAAVAAATLFAAPTLASAAPANNREQVSVSVKTSDLDLSRPEHVERLRGRVARAVAAACNPGDRLNADMSPDWQCRNEMGANAEVAMNRLIAAPNSRVASN
jgi:UrcA family protein